MGSVKDHWENIYSTKDHQQVGWFQEHPGISLQLLTQVNAKPEQSFIDVGCGASLLVDKLIDLGYQDITLLDVSDEALTSVRSRLGGKAGIPEYLCKDITRIQFKKLFDIWHDRAVFHFLTDAKDRKNYMATLERYLSTTGRAIIGTFSLDGPNSCSGLDVVQYDEDKMKLALPENLELISSTPSTHIMPGGAQQEYLYFVIKHKQ